MAADTRRNRYFVPGEGIAREVITADICKYLDNDATVRPGDYQGRKGYFVYAYRNLTSEMIQSLKEDSIRWEKEKHERAKRGPGRDRDTEYINSATYSERHEYGPSSYDAGSRRGENASSLATPGYPPTQTPPGQDYSRGPQPPYGDQQYPPNPSPMSGGPYKTISSPQGYPGNYPTASDRGQGRGHPLDYQDYPQDQYIRNYPQPAAPYGDSQSSRGPYASQNLPLPGGPRDMRYPDVDPRQPYQNTRPEARESYPDPRTDPRLYPRVDPRDPRPGDLRAMDPRDDPRMDDHMDLDSQYPHLDPRLPADRYPARGPEPPPNPRGGRVSDRPTDRDRYGDSRYSESGGRSGRKR